MVAKRQGRSKGSGGKTSRPRARLAQEGQKNRRSVIALAWIAQKPWIVPIPGTTKLHRLQENITATEVELTADDVREIEEALPEAHGARYAEANQRMIDR